MGNIKDIIDLVINLNDRSKNREIAAELSSILSMILDLQIEMTELVDQKSRLYAENASLRQKLEGFEDRLAWLKEVDQKKYEILEQTNKHLETQLNHSKNIDETLVELQHLVLSKYIPITFDIKTDKYINNANYTQIDKTYDNKQIDFTAEELIESYTKTEIHSLLLKKIMKLTSKRSPPRATINQIEKIINDECIRFNLKYKLQVEELVAAGFLSNVSADKYEITERGFKIISEDKQ